jgi:cyclic pyranopterin phosphate synthase
MPEHGIDFLSREALLSYEEMLRVVGIFHSIGIDKVRITGGEPFVRKDLIVFLEQCRTRYPEVSLTMTTNGILTGKYLDKLQELGITSINLSLDTLDPERFKQIDGRNS